MNWVATKKEDLGNIDHLELKELIEAIENEFESLIEFELVVVDYDERLARQIIEIKFKGQIDRIWRKTSDDLNTALIATIRINLNRKVERIVDHWLNQDDDRGLDQVYSAWKNDQGSLYTTVIQYF